MKGQSELCSDKHNNPRFSDLSTQLSTSAVWKSSRTLLSLCYNILFTFGRLTAGRTPPTPLRSPPLLVLLAVFTQTPPTDSVLSCCHCAPAVVCLDYHPKVLIFHCPLLSAPRPQGDTCISLALTVLEHRTAER